MIVYAILLLIAGLFLINSLFAYQAKHIDPSFVTTLFYQVKLIPLFLTANLLIGYGVKFTYKTVNNLTFALTLSKGIEIMVCVVIGYLFLREVPNWRTVVGVIIILVGFFIMKKQ
ncbi:hypothetical protein [Metabacillus iocasae]|uniref:Drug/metabolite transporter (DMT)-like permease n=1 Tax=Priestia iocasae TaxID=2291674 RepID=A0ABS2QWR9_9BACI|nr:hypothetical protein [Metabacillus iocasae]MBM7702934.1 drug/metabolite transporter (DMT)-like permease [Metabacillus iocasae]